MDLRTVQQWLGYEYGMRYFKPFRSKATREKESEIFGRLSVALVSLCCVPHLDHGFVVEAF